MNRQMNMNYKSYIYIFTNFMMMSVFITACSIDLKDEETDLITVELVGRVVDSDFYGLEDSNVKLMLINPEDPSLNKVISETSTQVSDDEEQVGKFSFKAKINTLKNKYRLFVSSEGYLDNNENLVFTLLSGQLNFGNIVLISQDNSFAAVKLSGQVVNGFQNDQPISNAIIQVTSTFEWEDEPSQNAACETQNNADDGFICDQLEVGDYEISIKAEGFTEYTETISLYDNMALGQIRLFESKKDDDLVIVLDWDNTNNEEIDLDLKLDLADFSDDEALDVTYDRLGLFSAQNEISNTSYQHLDFINHLHNFYPYSNYWPSHLQSMNTYGVQASRDWSRFVVDYSSCTYPAIVSEDFEDDFGDDDCANKNDDNSIARHQRDSFSGAEPEIIFLSIDQLTASLNSKFTLAQRYFYTVSESMKKHHPLAMAQVIVSSSFGSLLGTNARISIYQGKELVAQSKFDVQAISKLDKLNEWSPFYIEYGLDENQQAYFYIHAHNSIHTKTDMTQPLWLYSPHTDDPIDSLSEISLKVKQSNADYVVGLDQDDQWQIIEYPQLGLPHVLDGALSDFQDEMIDITSIQALEDQLFVAWIDSSDEAFVTEINTSLTYSCGNIYPRSIIKSPLVRDGVWIGSEYGISQCNNGLTFLFHPSEDQLVGSVTTSQTVIDHNYLLFGGSDGLFFMSLFNYDQDISFFESADEESLQNVSIIQYPYVMTEQGLLFKLTIKNSKLEVEYLSNVIENYSDFTDPYSELEEPSEYHITDMLVFDEELAFIINHEFLYTVHLKYFSHDDQRQGYENQKILKQSLCSDTTFLLDSVGFAHVYDCGELKVIQ